MLKDKKTAESQQKSLQKYNSERGKAKRQITEKVFLFLLFLLCKLFFGPFSFTHFILPCSILSWYKTFICLVCYSWVSEVRITSLKLPTTLLHSAVKTNESYKLWRTKQSSDMKNFTSPQVSLSSLDQVSIFIKALKFTL